MTLCSVLLSGAGLTVTFAALEPESIKSLMSAVEWVCGYIALMSGANVGALAYRAQGQKDAAHVPTGGADVEEE